MVGSGSGVIGSGSGLVGSGSGAIGGLAGVFDVSDVSSVCVAHGIGHGLDSTVGKRHVVFAVGGVTVTALVGAKVGATVVIGDGIGVVVDGGHIGVGGLGVVGRGVWGGGIGGRGAVGGGNGDGDKGGDDESLQIKGFSEFWRVGN